MAENSLAYYFELSDNRPLCGTSGRPCPKLEQDPMRLTEIGQFRLTPPCIYLFPASIPSPRNNPSPRVNKLEDVGLLNAMHRCFGGQQDDVNTVEISVGHDGAETVRSTTISRGGVRRKGSEPTPIRRS